MNPLRVWEDDDGELTSNIRLRGSTVNKFLGHHLPPDMHNKQGWKIEPLDPTRHRATDPANITIVKEPAHE